MTPLTQANKFQKTMWKAKVGDELAKARLAFAEDSGKTTPGIPRGRDASSKFAKSFAGIVFGNNGPASIRKASRFRVSRRRPSHARRRKSWTPGDGGQPAEDATELARADAPAPAAPDEDLAAAEDATSPARPGAGTSRNSYAYAFE